LLKDELDPIGMINKLRFEEAARIYGGVVANAMGLLRRAGLDWEHLVGHGSEAHRRKRLPLRGARIC
jgi:hypothetical protein